MRIRLDERAVATIVAALRFFQSTSDVMGPEIVVIATDGGRFDPLDDEEINTLCERLNAP